MNKIDLSEYELFDKEEGCFKAKEKKIDFKLLFLILFLIFFGLSFRAFHLQVVNSEYWKDLASGNRLRRLYSVPARGLIVDRKGNNLVFNELGFSLVIAPLDFPQEDEEKEKIYFEVKEKLNLDIKQEVEKLLDYQTQEELTIPLNIKQTEALVLKEKWSGFSGVNIEERPKRVYEENSAHILGYLGKIEEKEWEEYKKKNHLLFEWVGKEGLEKEYQDDLRGEPGVREVEVDVKGHIKKTLAKRKALPGKSLKLYLDLDLQKKAKEVLARKLEELNLKKGVVVALDAKTGGVLALVSLPDYDSNYFVSSDREKLNEILQSEDRPLFNRALSGTYPSGSTIKPIVALGALKEGIVSALSSILCKGELEVPNQYDPSIIYHYKDWTTHGIVDVRKAIAASCNVFFYTIGGGFQGIPGLGLERLTKYFKLFGLGQPTGIDLPQEGSGLVPTAEWKMKNKKEPWYLGDTYHLSIGQGDLLVTPIQVARYTMAIANFGKLYHPHLVQEILDFSGKRVKEFLPQGPQLDIPPENFQIVREGMRQAVLSGSAQALKDLKISSAAKTGTAENPAESQEPFSWFTCFAPFEDPEIVLTVLIEQGGEGYKSAQPVAKEILSWWQDHRY